MVVIMVKYYVDYNERISLELSNSDEDIIVSVYSELNFKSVEMSFKDKNGKYISCDKDKELTIKKDLLPISLEMNGRIVANINESQKIAITKLNVQDTRMMCNGQKLNERKSKLPEGFNIKTDLHSHFPATIKPKDLINIALKAEHDVLIPKALLISYYGIKEEDLSEITSIDISNEHFLYQDYPKGKAYKLKDLVKIDGVREKMEKKLSIEPDTINTFENMEKIYAARDPFVKDIKLFKSYLRKMAEDYKESGVTHCTQTFSKLTDKKWLKIIHDVMPQIEKNTGVHIDFLVGIPRSYNTYEQIAQFKKAVSVIKSPYVKGIDILGSEDNSIYDSYEALIAMVEYAEKNNDFIVRVHGGENPNHPENVEGSVNSLMNVKENSNIHMRIGHGIYGSDDKENIDTIKKYNKDNLIIVEMNPHSNVALSNIENHIDNIYPIGKYSEEGVDVTVGSDGPALYYTDAKQLASSLEEFDQTILDKITNNISKSEEKFITRTNKEFATKKNNYKKDLKEKIIIENGMQKSEIHQSIDDYVDNGMSEKTNKEHLLLIEQANEKIFEYKEDEQNKKNANKNKKDVEKKQKKQQSAIKKEFKDKFVEFSKSVKTSNPEIKLPEDIKDKKPKMITGAIYEKDKDKLDKDLKKIKVYIKNIIAQMDVKKEYIMIPANDFGVQKIVIDVLQDMSSEIRPKLVGMLPLNNVKLNEEWKVEENTKKTLDKFDYLIIDEKVNNIYRVHDEVTYFCEEHNMEVIVFGGCHLTGDYIRIAENVGKEKNTNQLKISTEFEGKAKDRSKNIQKESIYDFGKDIKNNNDETQQGFTGHEDVGVKKSFVEKLQKERGNKNKGASIIL
jgi:hypothetical protein